MVRVLNRIGRAVVTKGLVLATCSALVFGMSLGTQSAAQAQTAIREGKLQLVMLQDMASDQFTVLSTGVLRDLEVDPLFDGNYLDIYNRAATILDNYTPVVRGGFFPENSGIPRDRQLTVDEAVYQLFRLDNGHELMLYRSPIEDTSRYFIRQS